MKQPFNPDDYKNDPFGTFLEDVKDGLELVKLNKIKLTRSEASLIRRFAELVKLGDKEPGDDSPRTAKPRRRQNLLGHPYTGQRLAN